MFCKNCGKELLDGQTVCAGCGFAAGTGNSFCGQCGQPVQPGQAICTVCGFSLDNPWGEVKGDKSKLVAGLLGIFLGGLGIHNFYLGFTKKALIQLLVSVLTCGIGAFPMEIWGLVEGIMILMGKEGYNRDAQGKLLTE